MRRTPTRTADSRNHCDGRVGREGGDDRTSPEPIAYATIESPNATPVCSLFGCYTYMIDDFSYGSSATLTLPGALNLYSQGGPWVTAHLRPPTELDASAIDVGSIQLRGNVAGAVAVPVDTSAGITPGDQNVDGVPGLTVKFERAAVELTVTGGAAVPVSVTGTVAAEPFVGLTSLIVLRASHGDNLQSGTAKGCGDHVCNGVETCSSCPADCGVCCPDTDCDGIPEAGDGCTNSWSGGGRSGEGSFDSPYSDCVGVTWCAYCTTSRGTTSLCGPNGLGGTNCGLACY